MPLSWLTARPIAHRGLHDSAAGRIENTRSACKAAIESGYAIEVDLQPSSDGEAMVFHDNTLDRLTTATGPVMARTAAELKAVRFKDTDDAMMRLGELLELVAGRVPLIVELKSRFDGDLRLAKRAAELAAGYDGPLALMSFDPKVVVALAALAPRVPRGITAQRRYAAPEWKALTMRQKLELEAMLHLPFSRPHFIAYSVTDRPTLGAIIGRRLLGLPVLSWTVRTPEDKARAATWADQVIFEGFRP